MPIPEVKKIWMNGELVDWADAKVHLLTHALHYGSGVFEGIRAYKTERGPAVFRLTDHLKRLERSAKMYYMELPYSVAELLVQATKDVIKANDLEHCYIRPIVYRGYGEMGLFPLEAPTDAAIAVWPWGTYLGDEGIKHGVRTKISSIKRLDANALTPAAKSCGQYLNSQLAKIEVVKAGYEEAIMLNNAGFVTAGHRREHLHRPQRHGRDAADRERPARGHHPRHGDEDQRLRWATRWSSATSRAAIWSSATRLLHRHGGRDRADPRGRRPSDRRAGTHHPGASRGGSTRSSPARARSSTTTWSSDDGDGAWQHGHETQTAVQLYDTTLRDGMQQEGMSVSVDEKVRIALKLDELGIHFIEGGFPGSNPKEIAFFGRMERERLANAELVAFGMTRRKGVAAGDDPSCACWPTAVRRDRHRSSARRGACTSRKVLRVSRDENLRMIADSVAFLLRQGKRVIYDAEHFFDGYADDADYALRTLRAAAEAGAETICLCDTNGGTLPSRSIERVVARRRRARSARRSASTATTTATAPWPTPWSPSPPARVRCRAPSTATASAAATPTSSRSSRR